MTVEAVALECGFSSSAYFCKLFRAHTGMTPKQYRTRQFRSDWTKAEHKEAAAR